MKLKIMIAILVLLLFLNHCKSDKSELPLSQVPTQTITIDESKNANVTFNLIKRIETKFIVYSRVAVSPFQDKVIVYGLSSSNEGNHDTKLIALTYDKELDFEKEHSFFFGQGPQDVGSNNVISLSENNIFISENSNRRVAVYDNDWNFKKYVKYKRGIEAFELFENGTLYINGYLGDADNLDSDLEAFKWELASFPECELKTFFKTSPYSYWVKTGRSQVAIVGYHNNHSWFYKNKEIFIVMFGKYRMLKFDASGKMLQDVIIRVDEKRTDPSLKDTYLKEQGFSRPKGRYKISGTVAPVAAAIPLGKGIAIVRRKDYSTVCNGFADGDYIADSLQYQGKIKIPCFRNIYNLVPLRTKLTFKFDNRYLYLVRAEEEKLFLEKWEVRE